MRCFRPNNPITVCALVLSSNKFNYTLSNLYFVSHTKFEQIWNIDVIINKENVTSLHGNTVTSRNRLIFLVICKIANRLTTCRENLALIYFRGKKEIIKKLLEAPKTKVVEATLTPSQNGGKF